MGTARPKYDKWQTPASDEVAMAEEYVSAPTHAPGDKLFDVTEVVGSVYAGTGDSMTTRVAAFTLIARLGRNGEFQYPDEDGSLLSIVVSTLEPPR